MYTSRPLHFHIVCDGVARVYLETRLRLLTHPVHNISVRFYQLSYETMRDRVSREGAINTDHSAGIRMLPSWHFRLSMLLTNSSSWPHEAVPARTLTR
jgi:hypothetical protein